MKSVENFLDELASKPEAMAKLGQGEHKTKGDWLGALLELGKAWGYDLTAEELTAALREKGEALRKRTDAQAEAVRSLDEEALEGAAGGFHFCNRPQVEKALCDLPHFSRKDK